MIWIVKFKIHNKRRTVESMKEKSIGTLHPNCCLALHNRIFEGSIPLEPPLDAILQLQNSDKLLACIENTIVWSIFYWSKSLYVARLTKKVENRYNGLSEFKRHNTFHALKLKHDMIDDNVCVCVLRCVANCADMYVVWLSSLYPLPQISL